MEKEKQRLPSRNVHKFASKREETHQLMNPFKKTKNTTWKKKRTPVKILEESGASKKRKHAN